jgi:predicted trehalose synthase
MAVSIERPVLVSSTYHCTVCDETDQSVCREQTQAHDDRVLERLQAVLLLTCVYDEDKNRRGQDGLRKSVLDSGAARMQLWGDLLLGDVLVVRGEIVTVQAEGAYPYACAHVNLTV